ncbi:hypothetical protein CORC01_11285 [Colletotrichum orchidophilum]|uniref:Carboxypeptidase n=1 Tax=Colletotrichum orchidophilum TaxID=1209926 RepID=A0A1G4AW81_9PEZI|nr:uncharacterized protein CORC01_11285 [Colletotrichum orchidophilum]OHE93420.1 hypothetical protein CORC01_11285 [Colletotrichum orchidophilum]
MSLRSSVSACLLHLALLLALISHCNASPTHLQSSSAAKHFPATASIPGFSLRLGPDTASVCNSSTPGITGFIDAIDGDDESHLFFWLFESKHRPSNDPVILWMTGGPGASSIGYGNLMELGPCRIAPEGGYTIDNPYGWNTNATLIFVDQPVSVGYSTGSNIPRGLQEASQMMDQFLRQLMIAFPQYADLDFYIAGESYGGSWVPALASTILDNQAVSHHKIPHNLNSNSAATDFVVQNNGQHGAWEQSPTHLPSLVSPINLKGILIGNGLIRLRVQNPGTFEALCSGPDSLLSTSQCLEWAPLNLWCEKNLGVCEGTGDDEGWLSRACIETHEKCSSMSGFVVENMKRNPYDWRRSCDDGPSEECYAEMAHIDAFLNQTKVKVALGVDEDVSFEGSSYEILKQWERVGDLWKSSDAYVNNLLDEGIRVLIYVGDKDLYCNAAGMRRLVNEGLAWHGHPFFRFREMIPWYHETKQAGRWKSYKELTYAEIFNSGHLAPFDLPAESASLINSWIRDGHPPAQ